MQELLKNREHIVIDCLGDSITWGMFNSATLETAIESGEVETGLDDGGQLFEDLGIYISGAFQSDPSYPEVLQEELNRKLKESGRQTRVETVNDGICGDWLTKDTCRRMSCDPDIVIVLMGGNNYYFNYPADGMLEYNIRQLKKEGKIVYLANYPIFPGEAHNEAFQSANEDLQKAAKKEKVKLIDLYSAVEEKVKKGEYSRPELFSKDHIHLSEKGYELIGNLAAEAVFEDIES